jgi:tripartite-type tricarboxylate transporter receptor subunit TctC
MHHQEICARAIAAWVGWIFLIACCWAFAAVPEYPTRPIRLVVSFAAGGGVGTLSRIITPQQLVQRIKSETAMWAAVIKDAGIKAE